jgi:hypothetical protein
MAAFLFRPLHRPKERGSSATMSLNLPPREFVDKWKKSALKETAASQSHFNDICYLVGHQTPAELDPTGQRFTFLAGAAKVGGGQGWADGSE